MMDIDKQLKKMMGSQKKKSSNYFDVTKVLKKPKYSKKKDWDGDGIPNWKDCQPRNIMRQDFNKYLDSETPLQYNFKFTDAVNKTLNNRELLNEKTERTNKKLTPNSAVQSNFNFKTFSNKEDDLIDDFTNGNKPVVDFFTGEGNLEKHLQRHPKLNNYEYIDFTSQQEMSNGVVENVPRRIYYKQGQEQRAEKIIGITQQYPATSEGVKKMNDNYHIQMGRLYGYPELEIKSFVMRQKGRR